MEHAQLTEEELQQSAALSEDDDSQRGITVQKLRARQSTDLSSDPNQNDGDGDGDLEMSDGDERAHSHAGLEDDIDGAERVNEDEDADGEADDDYDVLNGAAANTTELPDDEDDDAEGEEDEDEGVGAVKLKPGETDDEDDDSVSEVSESQSADGESEGDAAWEEDEEIIEGEDEEDEQSASEPTNTCIFCREDSEADTNGEPVVYLTCTSCVENAHQHCARTAHTMSSKASAVNWKCPECIDEDDEDDALSNVSDRSAEAENDRKSAVSNLEIVASASGIHRRDGRSVSDDSPAASEDDLSESPRHLRKRKTSPIHSSEDGLMSLRKRRRNPSDDRQLSQEGTPGEDSSSRPQGARTLRLRLARQKAVTILKPSSSSTIVTMRVSSDALRTALSQRYLPERKRSNRAVTPRQSRANGSRTREWSPEPMIAPFVSTTYSQPFYSFFDKESDEVKGKPYGGILTEAEADTSKTMPAGEDRRRFDEAKQRAEAEWKARIIAMQEEIQMPIKKPKKAAGPASQIECIEFGGWEIDTWYAAPYPEEYSRNRVLYICEFCLKYMNSDYVAWRHKLKCPSKHPPGDEIYRHDSVSVFEVDGRKNPVYCQNLCLLAKLFLGSKTLYYDVEPFLFYVLCEYDEFGYHFVGYFSKEKRASSQNNVSCILTLPIHQRKGYGNLLIDFSYLLTRAEQRTGSPEKPLSDMGLVSYRNYWRLIMCKYLLTRTMEDQQSNRKGLSIRKISEDTGMTADDVISALEGLRCLVRDPQTKLYAFRVDLNFCREYVAKWEAKNYVRLNPKALTWTPYVMGRSSAMNFELGPAINAIAPREDDEGEPQSLEVLPDAVTNVELPNGPINDSNRPKSDHGLVNGLAAEDKENNRADGEEHAEGEQGGERDDGDSQHKEEAWAAQYRDVPPTRFEVFPRTIGARRLDKPRPSVVRTPSVSVPVSTPRPRVSTGGSSSRKTSTARPKSSTSRRKTGGTGRGPGRWPKGTKKSDYGNADSGPGLPPAWIERARLAALSMNKRDKSISSSNEDFKEMKDVVRVQVDGRESENNLDEVIVKGPQGSDDAKARGASVEDAADGIVVDGAGDGEMDAEGEDE
ncbi:hypothetical protein jhhlp_006454 [Lomentospora prolificans]|uniref:Histone acetyltransferase n=1 Tax=Lomentospora prolificans TaxID=41688 RepID=A0A2N3N5Z3_9PEZI|nr:hypothetical protein jhhlp_006454 [Lomentospora prolificans]